VREAGPVSGSSIEVVVREGVTGSSGTAGVTNSRGRIGLSERLRLIGWIGKGEDSLEGESAFVRGGEPSFERILEGKAPSLG
jgi:hypothetical protein